MNATEKIIHYEELTEKILELLSDSINEEDEDLSFTAGAAVLATALDCWCDAHRKNPTKFKLQLATIGPDVERITRKTLHTDVNTAEDVW